MGRSYRLWYPALVPAGLAVLAAALLSGRPAEGAQPGCDCTAQELRPSEVSPCTVTTALDILNGTSGCAVLQPTEAFPRRRPLVVQWLLNVLPGITSGAVITIALGAVWLLTTRVVAWRIETMVAELVPLFFSLFSDPWAKYAPAKPSQSCRESCKRRVKLARNLLVAAFVALVAAAANAGMVFMVSQHPVDVPGTALHPPHAVVTNWTELPRYVHRTTPKSSSRVRCSRARPFALIGLATEHFNSRVRFEVCYTYMMGRLKPGHETSWLDAVGNFSDVFLIKAWLSPHKVWVQMWHEEFAHVFGIHLIMNVQNQHGTNVKRSLVPFLLDGGVAGLAWLMEQMLADSKCHGVLSSNWTSSAEEYAQENGWPAPDAAYKETIAEVAVRYDALCPGADLATNFMHSIAGRVAIHGSPRAGISLFENNVYTSVLTGQPEINPDDWSLPTDYLGAAETISPAEWKDQVVGTATVGVVPASVPGLVAVVALALSCVLGARMGLRAVSAAAARCVHAVQRNGEALKEMWEITSVPEEGRYRSTLTHNKVTLGFGSIPGYVEVDKASRKVFHGDEIPGHETIGHDSDTVKAAGFSSIDEIDLVHHDCSIEL